MQKYNPYKVKEMMEKEKNPVDLTILEQISILSTSEINRIKGI
jgi:hypothetical protein